MKKIYLFFAVVAFFCFSANAQNDPTNDNWSTTGTITSMSDGSAHLLNTGLNINPEIRIFSDDGLGTSSFAIRDLTANQMRLEKYTAAGASLIDINPFALDGVSAATFRFFRLTNTSGPVFFEIFKGNGTATVQSRLSANGNSFFHLNSGNVGIGTAAPATKLDVAGVITSTGGTSTDWNSAFGWGDHSTAGYLTSESWDYFSGSGNTGEIYHAGDIAVGSFTDPDGHGINAQTYQSGKGAVRGVDQSGTSLYAEGLLGVLSPGIAFPILNSFSLSNAGVIGNKPNLGGSGAAIIGINEDDNSSNYAGIFTAAGPAVSGTNYGVWSQATGAATNYAGYFDGRVVVEGTTTGADSTATLVKATVNHNQTNDTRAIEGISVPAPGYGYGVSGTGGWRGVYGLASSTTYTGFSYGVYGQATGSSAGTRIGVYGTASGGTTNWAGYFAGDVYVSSDMRIASTVQAAGYELSVNGEIICEELKVQDSGAWPDYVFNKNYDLMSLKDVQSFIAKNKHLPGVPSADCVEQDGISIGEMSKVLMEKIEELTLHTIEQQNLIENQQKTIENLSKKVDNLMR